jgi:hypothetical protein
MGPILTRVKAALWTSIIADESLLGPVFASYLLHDRQLVAGFNKDLIPGRHGFRETLFCSPLLVNAVLAIACVRV